MGVLKWKQCQNEIFKRIQKRCWKYKQNNNDKKNKSGGNGDFNRKMKVK